MATINSIAELAYRQVFPNPSIQNATHLGEFIATAKLLFADRTFYDWKEKMATVGEYDIPSSLLVPVELDVVNNRIDIKGLKIMRGIGGSETWIKAVGGINCDCDYVKHTLNTAQILCTDEYDGNMKPYIPFSNYILFPKGLHNDAKKIEITYVSDGTSIDDSIQVDDVIGSWVRQKLVDMYLGKHEKEDKTNNNNSNQ